MPLLKARSKTFPEFNPSEIPNYIDWRLPKNRREAVARVTHFRYLSGDLDHTQAGLVAADLLGLDNEQKAWFAVLFGHSYRAQNAAILMQEFPDIGNHSPNHILKWMETPTKLSAGMPKLNGNRMIYGNDSKWNRWKLHESIESVQNWLGGTSLYERLLGLVSYSNTRINRHNLEKAVSSWKYFGWMSTWLTLQMLWDFFKWDIDTWTIPFASNWSCYNGIMYIFGKEHLAQTKQYRPTSEDRQLAAKLMFELRDYLTSYLPYQPDSFSIESVICEYRKTGFGPNIKEYIGWTSSELALQYLQWKKWWSNRPDIDLLPIVAGLMARHKIVRAVNYDRKYFRILYETGMLQSVELAYPEMPSVYEYLLIPHPEEMPIKDINEDWGKLVTKAANHLVATKYEPTNKLNWKRGAKKCRLP